MKPTTLPARPTLLIDEPDFRLVQVELGEDVEHVLEVRDGVDAMGVQRWRKFETDSAKLKAIFGYLVRIATQKEQTNA